MVGAGQHSCPDRCAEGRLTVAIGKEVIQVLGKTSVITLAMAIVVLIGSSAFALGLQDLTLDSVPYSLDVWEPVYYTGGIQQFDPASDPWTRITNSYVGYSLPKLTIWDGLHQQKLVSDVWAVCIDTREWSANPQGAYLKQGWAQGDPDPHIPLSKPGRLNGTVLNQESWGRTTYLFSQYAPAIGAMTNQQRAAFQLAIWEVMSGDGGVGGGIWDSGLFTAQNVTGGLKDDADGYVKAAFAGSWSLSQADKALYFTGVMVNGEYKQDFLVYAPPVPEIPAVLLGPLGLAALGVLRRKLAK